MCSISRCVNSLVENMWNSVKISRQSTTAVICRTIISEHVMRVQFHVKLPTIYEHKYIELTR